MNGTLEDLLPDNRYIKNWNVTESRAWFKTDSYGSRKYYTSMNLKVSVNRPFNADMLKEILLENYVPISTIENTTGNYNDGKTIIKGTGKGLGDYTIVLSYKDSRTTVEVNAEKEGQGSEQYSPLVKSITSFVKYCEEIIAKKEEETRAIAAQKAEEKAQKENNVKTEATFENYQLQILRDMNGDYQLMLPLQDGSAGSKVLYFDHDLELGLGDRVTFNFPVTDIKSIEYIIQRHESETSEDPDAT